MRVSVVTISFNQAKYLSRCIDSVLGQVGVDLDYVVVDAGSTDGSRELILSYGDRLRYIFEEDDGPADGLNKGFGIVDGDVYGFINSDDYLLPGALSAICRRFAEHADCDLVSGEGYVEFDLSRERKPLRPDRYSFVGLLYNAEVIFQQGTFFRKEIFRRVGGFNVLNKTCWDYELFMDMVVSGGRHFVFDEKVAVFFLHDCSITGSGRLSVEYALDRKRIFKKYKSRDWAWFDLMIRVMVKVKRVIGRVILKGGWR